MALKLLVVDDEPEALKVLKTYIEMLGYEVVAIQDSREAARRVNSQSFDGIFVDARMPHVDGFELTKQIRASSANGRVPIVMLTGYNDAETMRKGFNAGITFFLGKPILKDRLIKVLNPVRGAILLEQRRAARLPSIIPVNCKLSGKAFRAQSIDLSETGMLMESTARVETGQELDLDFMLPESPTPLRLRAQVVRKQPPAQFAVQFVNPSIQQRRILRNFIFGATEEEVAGAVASRRPA